MQTTVPVKSSESSHWYLPDGSPFYSVPNASKPGEERPATLRDARKVGAVPSVTTVLNCVRKPGLDRWKIEQAILAALTLPRLPDEPDTAYAARVATDAEETSRKAADFGTRLHDAIEKIVSGETSCFQTEADVRPFAERFADWYAANQDTLIGCLVDWKTSSTMRAYDEWCLQMAAYHAEFEGVTFTCRSGATELTFASTEHGYGGRVDFVRPLGALDPLVCKNVIISSTEPGRIEVKEWTPEEIENGWETFKAILNVWQLMNNYFPNRKAV